MSYGKVTCTACDNLFRPCSFAHVHKENGSSPEEVPSGMGVLDTLHPVAEDACQEQGALTGTKTLKSRNAAAADDKKSSPRFSRAAVKILKEWLNAHNDNPYPTEDEKADLGRLTGLRYGQINTWLANARRRGKLGRGKPKGTSSPSIRPSSPVGIPSSSAVEIVNWENMNPLERWKHSPPTNEPAPMNAIKDALSKISLPSLSSGSPPTLGYTGFGSSRDSSHSISQRRAPSMTSLEQVASESTSSVAWSGSHESFGSFSSFGSGLHGKRDRRRRRKATQPLLRKQSDDKHNRVFQCTFCTDTFKSKYDWSRHEKSLHLSLDKFICCPQGGAVPDPNTGGKVCAYCLQAEPNPDHLETHGHQTCIEKGPEARTFYRKDHLRQHLRLMHNCELLPHMDTWKFELKFINSRCGFCARRFNVWQERVDHIAAHFKDGKKMIEWKGCRGLDPEVAANVLNAMPPYLIGIEQVSPEPFSATSPKRCMTVANHLQNGGEPATCWEILTVRLGCFAKQQSEKGILLTDALLQKQARLILYDDPDPWNQTWADNPEWLDLFKRAQGLDFLPTAVGGEGRNIPEDLEIYGDLGVRIPFSVQMRHKTAEDRPAGMSISSREEAEGQDLAQQQFQSGLDTKCARTVDSEGCPLRDLAVHQLGEKPKYQRYSTLEIPLEQVKNFETISAPRAEGCIPLHLIHAEDLKGKRYEEQLQIIKGGEFCNVRGPDHTMDFRSASASGSTSSSAYCATTHTSSGDQLSPSLVERGYCDRRCILSGLGVSMDGMSGTQLHSAPTNRVTGSTTHETQDAQKQQLNALDAALAGASKPSTSHQFVASSDLGPAQPKGGSLESGSGQQTSLYRAPAMAAETLFAPLPAEMDMQDICMTDFDFNDVSFENEIELDTNINNDNDFIADFNVGFGAAGGDEDLLAFVDIPPFEQGQQQQLSLDQFASGF